MKMRRLILLFVFVIALFTLASCGNEENKSSATTDNASTAEPSKYNLITIQEALELCGEPGNITEHIYYIKAFVKSVDNATYGSMTIEDETGSIAVYGSRGADGETYYDKLEQKPFKGDEVILQCTLQNFNGTKEIKLAYILEIISHQDEIDVSKYEKMTIASARAKDKGSLIRVEGVVAKITYANGMKPNGFYLVDDTNSIYVYDMDAAGRVKVGNKIEIAGNKTYWILDNEINNANKFNYKGCNQIDSVIMISNDNKENEINFNWVEESTVKAIMDNPVENDITTTIFKVNALVKKVENPGFVNYYIDDLDGITGSYCYTQCNGNDYSYLDEFDGKICTVYLSAINAKSTSSSCLYRFVPVLVKDDNYKFDSANAAKFSLEYYAKGQFEETYTGDPALEVITSAKNELVGFDNVVISYVSNDNTIVSFVTEDNKTIMHCNKTGSAEITITAEHNGTTASIKLTIEVEKNEEIDYVSVAEAIKVEKGQKVTVRGIVGPSLVNQVGFYLIDETGVVAIRTEASALEGLKIGHDVVITGDKDLFLKDSAKQHGQTCINNAIVAANYYGNHEYSTATFDETKTLADLYALDVMVDYSTKVFITTATVFVEESAYYTNIKLKSGDITFSLYCSSANQYNFLKPYAGQELKFEIAPCNWNGKTYWAGCVLAVYTENGKVLNTLNFQ